MNMTEVVKSFTSMQRRRMVLDMFDPQHGPEITSTAVFFFGDGPFVLEEVYIKKGRNEHDCTRIRMGGEEYYVIQSTETINDFLFGE